MNELLTKSNLLIRSNRPLDNPNSVISTFRRNNFLQLTFQTSGCRYSSMGTCTMCNYGKGISFDSETILEELEKICTSEEFYESEMILLGASGSFLDDVELSAEMQYQIMERISQTHIKEIFIETHYKSVSIHKLKKIRSIFPTSHINIEMGLESITEDYQNNILNKNISPLELKKVIDLIHAYNMEVSLNLLLGMPFLTPQEQLADTKKSIFWALDNGADYVVVFPINIQPYTVFEWWYSRGYISITSPWLLFTLLLQIPEEKLDSICLAWYGNRCIEYSSERKTQITYACPQCQSELVAFFEDLTTNYDIEYRKERIHWFSHKAFPCNCRERMFHITQKNNNTPAIPVWRMAHQAMEEWVNDNAIN